VKRALLAPLPFIRCGNIKNRVLISPEYNLSDTGTTEPPPQAGSSDATHILKVTPLNIWSQVLSQAHTEPDSSTIDPENNVDVLQLAAEWNEEVAEYWTEWAPYMDLEEAEDAWEEYSPSGLLYPLEFSADWTFDVGPDLF
jgi:hypothetical protein